MRYLKAGLVALVGGFMLTVAVTTMGGRRCVISGSHANCHYTTPTGWRDVLFALSFAAVFVWFVPGRRRLPGL